MGMTRQPTQLEIQQAKELQRLGLCQRAKEWIMDRPSIDGLEVVDRVSKEMYIPDHIIIGPLATASECYPEMVKIVMPHKLTSEGTAYIFELVAKNMHCGDIDQAFRQTLIELAKEG